MIGLNFYNNKVNQSNINESITNFVVFSCCLFHVFNAKLDRRFFHPSWNFFNNLLFNNCIRIKYPAWSSNAGWREKCSPLVNRILSRFFIISISISTFIWAYGPIGYVLLIVDSVPPFDKDERADWERRFNR